jgi:hypothetical protein
MPASSGNALFTTIARKSWQCLYAKAGRCVLGIAALVKNLLNEESAVENNEETLAMKLTSF